MITSTLSTILHSLNKDVAAFYNINSRLMETMTSINLDNITITDKSILDKYEANLTEFSRKNIEAVMVPTSLEELKKIVSISNESKMNLFVTSTGKNWGLGSKQPITQNSLVVHLKKMNKIIDVNEKYRYAIIEPGVTQKQLSDYLLKNHPGLKFPVTGSAKETSIVGNILERGVAAFGHRNNMVVGMQIVLPNGKVLHTGFWHYFNNNDKLAFHYPFGHGPDLRGLFTQSNLGIVSKMAIRLQPRLEGYIVTLKLKEVHLKNIINLLKYQYEQKLLDDGILITNQNDPRTTNNKNYKYNGEWVVCAAFSGPKRIVRSKRNELRKQYKNYPIETIFLSSKSNKFSLYKSSFIPYFLNQIQKSDFLKSKFNGLKTKSGSTIGEITQSFNIVRNFFNGIPSNYSIETMAAMNNTTLENEDIDNSNISGLSLVLPAVPFDGESAMEVSELVNTISKKWNVKPFHNLASVSELAFEGFYRIYFDRKDQLAIRAAHAWSKEIHLKLKEKGYYPYRIDNKLMKDFIDENDVYWQTISKIKQALDENHILSKGKYNLT